MISKLPPIGRVSSITVGIPTCNRYEQLAHALVSISHQTVLPYEVIIVDDTPVPVDLRNVAVFQHIFTLLHHLGVNCEVIFGARKGQHHSHQMVQEIAKGNLVFRMDDDCIAQPNVLQTLRDQLDTDKTVGAVAPLVLMPDAPVGLHPNALNKITDLQAPNMQWFKWQGVRECEHLYSCFMYRKGIAKYELSLSPVAHREETIFTHRIFREGYKLMVNANATVWHFRSETGGIRMHNNPQFYESDERIFQNILKGWNIQQRTIVVLDNGIGDHYAFKNILPKLRLKSGAQASAKHEPLNLSPYGAIPPCGVKPETILIYCCYPDVFYDEPDLQLGSIAEAKQLYGENLDKWNIYQWMQDGNWNSSIVEAFEGMYLNLKS